MKKLSYLFLALLILAFTTDDNNNVDNSNTLEKEWLYTHTALEATATSSTTIVMPFTEDIFAFTDRPNREYKYISGDEFASYWNDYDDENSFKLDPPNAVLTWVDADGVSEVEVVITDANFDGNNVIYTIENTSITANQSFEDVSLFVDGNGSSNNVYLASNGVTIKASAGVTVDSTATLYGIPIVIVDNNALQFYINQGESLQFVCTSLVTDMSNMLQYAPDFNQNISSWDTSNVTNMNGMFEGATDFNQNISSWDVSKVTNMESMFQGANAFNQPIENWNVSNVTNCSDFGAQEIPNFTNCSCVYLASNGVTIKASAGAVNGDTGVLDGVTYTVVNLSTLNSKISNGDDVTKVVTSKITDMNSMFESATSFNQDISSWDVSNVTDMYYMFAGTPFNQDISNWDVSNVTNMDGMFYNSSFNQDIGNWDVSNVTNMNGMFNTSVFNQDISTWDVSSVTDMNGMFLGATDFNQDLSSWNVDNVTNCTSFSVGAPLTEANTPNFTNCTP